MVAVAAAIFVFIASKGLAIFYQDHLSLGQFLFSTHWDPGRDPESGGPLVGSLVFLTGSLAVTGLAILLAAPLSILAAAFMVEVQPKFGKQVLRPAIEVFVGIPSVVYGWVGLTVLVPLIAQITGEAGFTLLAGGVVLAVMIMPTIVTVTVDALEALGSQLKEAAYGLGSTRWQTIWHVLLPAARSSILTGIVLGMARAFGEALAVQMVIGNKRVLPGGLFQPATTLTSGITMDMGNSVLGTTWNNALWSLALLLLLVTLGFIVLIRWIGKRGVTP
jgi:phosphate transport system permease protein